ncbi:hypothetical protein HDU83_009843 [Entophlyctis luteolus]|nr:hypothetical protein HDU83_009843 [Entophlyctis luteolus]
MSQLFDFSHIINASTLNYQLASPLDQTLVQPSNLQDEIDRFLLESAAEQNPIASPSSASSASGTLVTSSPPLFGFGLNNPLDFLFSFPVSTSTSPSAPLNPSGASISVSPPSTEAASSSQSKPTKSNRGRKPKILSEEEKAAQEQLRKEKNKEFAQVSRDRKRKHIEELEQTNATLAERVKQLEQANSTLMARVRELSGAADTVGSMFKSLTSPASPASPQSLSGQQAKLTRAGVSQPFLPPGSQNPPSGAGQVARPRALTSAGFSLSSLWPFRAPQHSQQLYPLLSFFRRRVFG